MEKERIQKMPEKPQAKMAKVRARVQKTLQVKKNENNVKTGELQRLQRKRKPVFFSAVSIFTFTYPLDMAGTIRFWIFWFATGGKSGKGKGKVESKASFAAVPVPCIHGMFDYWYFFHRFLNIQASK